MVYVYSLQYSYLAVQAINKFLLELRLKESSSEKRRKLNELSLNDEEWERVSLFCNLLQVSPKLQYLRILKY